MLKQDKVGFFSYIKSDFPAGVVTFFVALPLCLGISLASDAPLFSGIITAIIGGIVVGYLSKSPLGVSGPAAGMTIIVAAGIARLGGEQGYEHFLMAVVLAGALQVLFAFLRMGKLGNFFPASVVKGLLASIGLILIFKQIPHGLGDDQIYEGIDSFINPADDRNTFQEIFYALSNVNIGALFVFVIGLTLMVVLRAPKMKEYLPFLKVLPVPLFVVFLGVLLNAAYRAFFPEIALTEEHLVNIPTWQEVSQGQASYFDFPSISKLFTQEMWITAFTVALVASVETLASLDAIEKLDKYKRVVPLSRELGVQGIGNMLCGLFGGLPLTFVIIRSSANIDAGARTKLSAIIHGFLMLFSVFLIPQILNQIPLAALASILIFIGYQLASPTVFKSMYSKGLSQFAPFVLTIIAIFFTNLLWGLIIGLIIGVMFVMSAGFRNAMVLTKDKNNYLIRFFRDVSFLNKGTLRDKLYSVPSNAFLIIDGTKPFFIDKDIIETIEEFRETAKIKNITIEIKRCPTSPNAYFKTADDGITREIIT